MGISVFLHQIPCWAELCQLLANMSDEEINDLISQAWNYGTFIAWGDESNYENGGISKFIPWNAQKNDTKNVDKKIPERFSAALKYIHEKKLKGDYTERDVDIQLKCGGKNGKFWKLKTKNCSYTVSYGKLYNNSPTNPSTMSKTFPTAADCYKEAQKKIKEKKRKKYKVDYDNSINTANKKYNNEYLKLAQKIDAIVHKCAEKQKQFADIINEGVSGLFDNNICILISEYCNEDKIDHYNADKVFDDIACPKSPISRLLKCVENIKDKSPSAFDIHLLEGIYGNGQEFGTDVCYGSIRVFSPKEMKIFATRVIKRLMDNDNDNELKQIIFGVKDIKMNDNNENVNEPSVKRRKLNDCDVKNIDEDDVYDDDIIYKVAYGLSASGIFDEKKQEIVWKKVFKLDDDNIPWSCYEGNHSLCVLSFGLNAAAMNRGVIAHYW
eukprot:540850_1